MENVNAVNLASPDLAACKLNDLNYILEDIKKKNYDRSTVNPVILEYERNHKVHSNSREARESRVKFLVELLK